MALPLPVQEDGSLSFQVLGADTILLYGCETWILTRDLRRRLNSFSTMTLRRILGYRCSAFVSNERLLRETQMRFVTCIAWKRQLRLYEHVTRFPDADPAHQIH